MSEIFVVLDLETSGLDKNKDVVLEIGALHIDMKTLAVLSRFQIHAGMSANAWNGIPMDLYVRNMHNDNNLYQEVTESALPCSEHAMDHWLCAWLMTTGARQGTREIVLCGNSIHFDRGFIEERLPGAAEFLFHRMVDTSAMRTVFKQWCGEPVKEAMKHRALEDCFASLNTLRWQKEITVAGLSAQDEYDMDTGTKTHQALMRAAERAVAAEWDLSKFQDESAAYFLVHDEERNMVKLAEQAKVAEKMAEQAKSEAEIEAGLTDEELNPWVIELRQKKVETAADASLAASLIASDISEFEADLAHEQRVGAEVASLIAAGRGTEL